MTIAGPSPEQPRLFFPRLGYHPTPGFRGEEAYARRLGRLEYPRFHLYVQPARPGELRVRLHLDQKRPSYPGSHAHAAEYEGPVLAAEADRIRRLLGQ